MNGEPLVEQKQHETSVRYRLMAERLDHNIGAPFGGSCVIIPPAGGGDPIELLMLDSKGDPAQFWGTILTRAQLELKAIDDKRAIQQGFGGIR